MLPLWVVVLGAVAGIEVFVATWRSDVETSRLVAAALLPCLFMGYGLKRKSLDYSGAFMGWTVSFAQYMAHVSLFVCLGTFFVTSSILTKFKSREKKKLEDDFKEGGQRNWIQVLCNGGCNTLYGIAIVTLGTTLDATIDPSVDLFTSFFLVASMSSFACCNGDTWASEVGPVLSSGNPRLITTWKEVPKGTNGGISLVGTIASALGGFVVGLAYCFGDWLVGNGFFSSFHCLILGFVSGFLGSSIDSILGATVQYSGFDRKKRMVVHHPGANVDHISGISILDNHLVNFVSSVLTGLIVSGTYCLLNV